MTKKLFCFLLTLVMLLSVLPMAVLAEDESIEEPIEAAEELEAIGEIEDAAEEIEALPEEEPIEAVEESPVLDGKPGLADFSYDGSRYVTFTIETKATAYYIYGGYWLYDGSTSRWSSWAAVSGSQVTVDLEKFAESIKFESGTYTINFRAFEDTYCFAESTVTFVYTSTMTKLDSPTHVRWDGTTVRWDAVENAAYYVATLVIWDPDGHRTEKAATQNSSQKLYDLYQSALPTTHVYYEEKDAVTDSDYIRFVGQGSSESIMAYYPKKEYTNMRTHFSIRLDKYDVDYAQLKVYLDDNLVYDSGRLDYTFDGKDLDFNIENVNKITFSMKGPGSRYSFSGGMANAAYLLMDYPVFTHVLSEEEINSVLD